LFPGTVSFEELASIIREDRWDYCLAIKETVHSVSDDIKIIELTPNAAEWNKLIKIACDNHKIKYAEPEFHLLFDYYYGNWKWAHYHGEFFYGMLFDWEKSAHLIKEVLKNHREVCEKAGWDISQLLEEILPKISPTEFRKWIKIDEKEGIIEYCIEEAFNSEFFINWVPDNDMIREIMHSEFICRLDELWALANNPICIGSINTFTGLRVFLGIRSTWHSIRCTWAEEYFHLEPIHQEDYNELIKSKCQAY
jgi:hypothetical protein